MQKSLSVLLISSVVLAGCGQSGLGQSRLNPLNWFGSAKPVTAVPATTDATVNPLIPERSRLARDDTYQGELVANITDLIVEQTPGGALLRVNALAAAQGSHDVRLEALNEGEPIAGVLVYELRAIPLNPRFRDAKVGSEATRRITAAAFVSEQTLARVNSIEVRGLNNTLASRR
ncbi:hypothetical protein [Thalassobius sp. Cn5-15]|uniref:hypothetical protein n=1 Tax=Thalassobius sp. Cn5-15 TaxID=2917763 RepID=UPI001EF29E87|nr:hypothetical protein [Thalassobius sp. Cn5-15]MCG7492681.1 hypothetical protein [Thalassobius sp. Cn5-15]